MIWRLPHPVRGLAALVLVLLVGSTFGGFGVGLPELTLMLLLAVGALAVAGTRILDRRDATP